MNQSQLLLSIIQSITPVLEANSDEVSKIPQAPGKWSKIQILGHLVDSAINNIGRIIHAQQTDDFMIEGYAQEFWVEAQNYANADWKHTISLFILLNQQMARIIDQISEEVLDLPRNKHNLKPPFYTAMPQGGVPTLRFWIDDYICHMENHICQVIPDYTAKLLRRE